jgi:glycerophosphoryl diester phosphodiesterase
MDFMSPDSPASNIIRVAHRGGAGHAPENTLRAIENAIAIGVDYVEIDVQSTADDHLVVMHDKRVDRTTNGSGRVTALTLEYIRSLDAGEGERVPLLSEVLELVNGLVGVMIELITPHIAMKTHRLVKKSGMRVPVLYASFLHSELIAVRQAEVSTQTLALLEGVPISGARFAIEARASHVGICFDSVTPEFLHSLKSHGLQTFVYTLNDPRDIGLARDLGVNGIITDYPERI